MIYDRFSVSPSPLQNHLLAALAIETQNKLFPHLELVVLSPGEVLADLGEKMVQVYFPIDSTVSLMCNIENGGTTEVAIVGNEGVLGVAGGSRAACRCGDVEGRVRVIWAVDGIAAALRDGADHASIPDFRVQPIPFDRPAAVPTVAAITRPLFEHRLLDDSGTNFRNAGSAPRGRHGRCKQIAKSWGYSICTRPHQGT